MNSQLTQLTANSLAVANVEEFRLNCQNFTQKLNATPSEESKDSTPDGRAKTILISHIEMLLDEYFFGLWTTENFKWNVVSNEIVGSIDLIIYHPSAMMPIKRVGAAAIQIMVDKVPDQIKNDPQKKNEWALNVSNKKSNALDMSFPKLKAECLKNAANSLGQIFGRDLNRKKKDVFNPLLQRKLPVLSPDSPKWQSAITALLNEETTIEVLQKAYELSEENKQLLINSLIPA